MPPSAPLAIEKLPQLTRVVALELEAVHKLRAKSVDGADFPPSSFAYLGDLKRTETWQLPIDFPGDAEKTKVRLRLAIATFDLTEMPDAKKKARAWRRTVAAAQKFGVPIAAEGVSAEIAEWRTAAQAESNEPDDQEDADEDRFDMSFSSEAPVSRWFGDEILDHSAGCVDMTRAAEGLAYLVDHDTGDQVGIVENLRIEKKKLRGTVRFSRSQRGQDIKRDVQDKIRPFTSIAYRVNEMVLEKEEKAANGTKRTYRVSKWTPMEGSTVAVPADVTVGAGRAQGQEEFPVSVRFAVTTPTASIQLNEVRTMNPKEAAEILRLCNTHGIDNNRAAEMIEKEGMTVDMASREILAEVGKRDGKIFTTPAAESSAVELTAREQKEYSICRGVMTHVRNIEENKHDGCLEIEVSEQIAKRHEGKNHGGLFVPWRLKVDAQLARDAVARYGAEMLKRAGLDSVTATKGSELVFTEPGPFIQFLYNKMRLKELGATTMSGLQGNVAFPKQTGRATGSWVAENPGSDVADSNLTLSQVLMSPKTYQTSSSYSRQLLAQAVVDIDNLVRADLASDAGLAIDKAGINGTGGGNDPTGILSTAGVQNYVLAADVGNGGKPTWDDVTIMEEKLEDVNADQVGSFAWLTTPGIKGLFKRTPRLLYAPAGGTVVNVTGDPIWTDDNEIDGLMARQTNQVPSNLVKGTSGAICNALILGVFSSMINGLWGSGFELVVDPYRLKKQGMIELTTFILTDWALRYPSGFVKAVDCLKS